MFPNPLGVEHNAHVIESILIRRAAARLALTGLPRPGPTTFTASRGWVPRLRVRAPAQMGVVFVRDGGGADQAPTIVAVARVGRGYPASSVR